MLNKIDHNKHKNSIHSEQRLITDLVAELAIVLNDKANLQNDNATLKFQCQELKHKLLEYERVTNEERNLLTENIKQSKETIQEKEISLAQKDVQNLQEQKKFVMEIGDLKAKLSNQKDVFSKKEVKLAVEIESLKSNLIEANKNAASYKQIAESFRNKYIKYKGKVKYAIGLINTLTAALESQRLKPELCNKESQTAATDQNRYEGCTSSCSLHNQYEVQNEKKVLAELFFKPHSSTNEIETIFFMPSKASEKDESDY